MPHLRRLAARSGHYSDAVVVEGGGLRWIHIAGQTARAPAEAGLTGQTEQVFDQLSQILEAEGTDLSAVVEVTVYLTDLSEYPRFAEVRARRMSGHLPASAAVEVGGLLDGALVEVSALAVTAAVSAGRTAVDQAADALSPGAK